MTNVQTSKYVNSKVFNRNVPNSLRELPPFIHQCMRYIEDHCLKVEGIFRLSAQVNMLDSVIQELEKSEGRYVIPLEQYNATVSPHLAANIIKLYFRELRDPLLSFENYDMFIAVSAMDDGLAIQQAERNAHAKHVLHTLMSTAAKSKNSSGGGGNFNGSGEISKVKATNNNSSNEQEDKNEEEEESVASILTRAKQEKLKHVLQFLPKGHFTILSQLCHFLHLITKHQDTNKMNAHNLAIVFAPNILRTNQPQSTQDLIKDTKFSNSLMTEFILDPEFYFPGGDMMSVLRLDDRLDRVFATSDDSNRSSFSSSSNSNSNSSANGAAAVASAAVEETAMNNTTTTLCTSGTTTAPSSSSSVISAAADALAAMADPDHSLDGSDASVMAADKVLITNHHIPPSSFSASSSSDDAENEYNDDDLTNGSTNGASGGGGGIGSGMGSSSGICNGICEDDMDESSGSTGSGSSNNGGNGGKFKIIQSSLHRRTARSQANQQQQQQQVNSGPIKIASRSDRFKRRISEATSSSSSSSSSPASSSPSLSSALSSSSSSSDGGGEIMSNVVRRKDIVLVKRFSSSSSGFPSIPTEAYDNIVNEK